MPLRLFSLFAVFAASNAFSIDRRELLTGLVASISATVNPLVSNSAELFELDPIDFSGVYRDPQHPSGYRVVRSAGDGLLAITMQDDLKSKTLQLEGSTKYDKKTGETLLSIDFSPKGGPSSLPATYSADRLVLVSFCDKSAGALSKGSISFPDGNVWVKESGIQGVYSDLDQPEAYRVIRELGNAKLAIEVANGANSRPVVLTGVINKSKGTAVIDFSPRSGPKSVSAELEDGKLVFPGGNEWRKL